MRTGYLQFAPEFGLPDANLATVRDALEDVNADLVVLPELPFTGYSFRDRDELLSMADEPDDSPVVGGLMDICRRRGIRIVTGYAERSGESCFNSALLVGPGGIEGRYRKLHLFNREKEYFDPGDLPLQVFEVGESAVGMMVCFDWVFPEVVRTLAIRGADLICHPANLVLSYCQRTMLSRCTENLVFAVTANRTGSEHRTGENLVFTGQSQIAAPGGEVLSSAGPHSTRLSVVEMDPALARDKMMTPANHILNDRRPEYYQE